MTTSAPGPTCQTMSSPSLLSSFSLQLPFVPCTKLALRATSSTDVVWVRLAVQVAVAAGRARVTCVVQ